MKQVYATILSLIYLYCISGITLHQHYCMGELVNTSLFNTNEGECGKCGMDKHTEASKDCCKDVPIVIKSGDSHTFSQTVYNLDFSPIIVSDPPLNTSNVNLIEEMAHNVFWSHAPPPVMKKPLYIRYHTFRI